MASIWSEHKINFKFPLVFTNEESSRHSFNLGYSTSSFLYTILCLYLLIALQRNWFGAATDLNLKRLPDTEESFLSMTTVTALDSNAQLRLSLLMVFCCMAFTANPESVASKQRIRTDMYLLNPKSVTVHFRKLEFLTWKTVKQNHGW